MHSVAGCAGIDIFLGCALPASADIHVRALCTVGECRTLRASTLMEETLSFLGLARLHETRCTLKR